MPVDVDVDIAAQDGHLQLEPGQDLVLFDHSNNEVLRLDASSGIIRLRQPHTGTTIQIQGNTGNLLVGGAGGDGDLLLYPASASSQDFAEASIHLNADGASMRMGDPGRPGTLRVRGSNEQVELSGASGSLIASGRVEVRTTGGSLRAQLADTGDATIGGSQARGRLEIRNASSDGTVVFNGELGRGRLGGDGTDGRIDMRRADGTTTIVLNAATGNLGLGAPGGGDAGALFVKDGSGVDTFTLNGSTGEARIGAAGNSGFLAIRDAGGQESVRLHGGNGSLSLGRFGTAGEIFLVDAGNEPTVRLIGATGNMNLSGDVRFTSNVADCAEEFDLADPAEELPPGSVVVLGEAGRLTLARRPCDRRVAGVVSGAGGLRPGVILGEDRAAPPGSRCHVAVLGRVAVHADARPGPIAVGDLLTSSAHPGHAMRVSDPGAAQGAIIGKSLGRLDAGVGLVEMLVTLQ